MVKTSPTRAPSTDLPSASLTLTRSKLSPARGGSRAIWTRRSPARSASEAGFDRLQAASSASSAARELVTLFMISLRGSRQPEIATHGALQLREALLVGGEMHRLVHLVHAQLTR